MEMWELFLKGLAKSFEEFAMKMIEKGKEADESESGRPKVYGSQAERTVPREKPPQRKRTIPHKDLGALETQILDIVGRHRDGVTLKEVAAELDVQWHFLRIPFRQLTMEGKLIKEDKIYRVGNGKSGSAAAPPPEAVKPETVENPAKTSDEPSRTGKAAQPRRRVVDARELERREQQDAAVAALSIRDRERLRYRILTALRGRPEGLNLEKLSAVLGMELSLLTPILDELQAETKVIKVDDDKFRLP